MEIPKQHLVFRLPEGTISAHKQLVAKLEPLADIGQHEVLVKIKAVALNYRDIAICNGTYPLPFKPSLVPRSDACGEIVQVGSQVKSLQVGDRVIGLFIQGQLYGSSQNRNSSLGGTLDGVLQEYRIFDENGVAKIPKKSTMTDSEAASLVCAGTTAWNALYGLVPLKPGQSVLIQGTGGVSMIALQIAKAAGAVTIVTSSSDEKLQYVKSKYGADYTINYRTSSDWEKKALEYTDGIGVDYVIENGGIGTIQKSIESLAHGGHVSIIGILSSLPREQYPNVALLEMSKSAVIRGIYVGSKQLVEELVRFYVTNDLHVGVDKEFKFTEAGVSDAYDYLISQKHIGKVCITL
jgi:NADPH:quinone reductase-like Zn-dependent oxidoreductase